MKTIYVTLSRAEIIKALKDAATRKAAIQHKKLPGITVREFDLDTMFQDGIPDAMSLEVDLT